MGSFKKKVESPDEEPINILKMRQLRGKYNCSPPESMRRALEEICEVNGLAPLAESYVNFKSEDKKEKKKIKQIGEAILDKILSRERQPELAYEDEDLPF